ncbi:MAG: PLP-dependent aminotransferase family protein [Cytophagaceae bacterium]|nr:PLP-dependent aminotransferase family protein [Cytophagaceae bacterium]MBK9935443.1 PLP-dependent aminotransferase family protein [Cytophagaceae bacterium]MBL0301885.1 PLP-dependent aminotransferase family protein [Cytophagaceae bacterium]
MFPFKSHLKIEKGQKVPVYSQLGTQIIGLIKSGLLPPGFKMPGSRIMSELLSVHRKTITQVYSELQMQGWLETLPGSGTFVPRNIPVINPQKILIETGERPKKAGFFYAKKEFLIREPIKATDLLHLDDGFPDPRLAPLPELARAYRSNLLYGNSYQKLGYGDTAGLLWLRKELSSYLNESRSLKINENNILIVRGTIMALYLTNLGLVKTGDKVAMGWPGWLSARISFLQAGAEVIEIPTDEYGIDTDALEIVCQKQKIRLLYVTPHHNYPTTYTLKADRRVKLLQLAEKYDFIIFEDDYDYDFHYQSRPLLPLASADSNGRVLYSGSFTKSISPGFRVGYLVATEDVIQHLSHHRRLIDRQGDNMLENALAQLLHEGIIQKHLRRSLKEYKTRRDFFCEKLSSDFSGKIEFQIPEGGMSVWAQFDPKIDMKKTAETALKKGMYFSDGATHDTDKIKNCTRLGFASSTVEELDRCLKILRESFS